MKKKNLFSLAIALFLLPMSAFPETVAYKCDMTLRVPRIYDNMQSQGYRKNQTQKITGYVYVDKSNLEEGGEPAISAAGFFNKTHKVSGKNVTYADAEAEEIMWRYIGSNKTGVFKNAQIKFSIDLDPSYNIGENEPDNTLIVTLSGYGQTDKTIKGHVTGQIGCGCYAYGHVSPTRTAGGNVSDISPLSGTFTMKRVSCSK